MVETVTLCGVDFYPPEADEGEPELLESSESIDCPHCLALAPYSAEAAEAAVSGFRFEPPVTHGSGKP